MIKNYIRHFYKDMIWAYLGIIGTIYFVLYSCYNMPTFASYHNYGFTYFFVVTMLCIIIFGTRYQYKEFKKSCIECQKAIQAKKEQYKNFTLDTLVDLIYDNDVISLNLLGCPGCNVMENLLSLEKQIKQTKQEIGKTIEKYDQILHEQNRALHNLEHQKNIIMNSIDVNKINNTKRFIWTIGFKSHLCGDEARTIDIDKNDVLNDFKILRNNCIGCKNCDGFFGKGFICGYGRNLSYGYGIFEIGLIDKFRDEEIKINENDICDILYFLNLLQYSKSKDIILEEGE